MLRRHIPATLPFECLSTRLPVRIAWAALTTLLGCAPPDTLVGTWQTTLAALGRAEVIRVSFAAPSSLEIVQTLPPDPSATTYPGCTEIRRSTGGTWQDESGVQVSINFDFAIDTLERTGCTNSSDNQPPMTDAAPLTVLSDGTYSYHISGSELDLTQGSGDIVALDRVH